jgi:limonene-1,2-epoxide hydrolase
MNDLRKFFDKHEGRLLDKWHHYFDVYDRHLSKFRGKPINFVEFGVSQGGSIQMWREYFGPQANIFGVDINPNCKQFEGPGVKIFIGDQEDRTFLKSLATQLPTIDILIDDGGHTMKQQIHTYEELFHKVDANGVFLIEDLHTSYWKDWGGAYQKKGTFMEYSKQFIDEINAWHSHEPNKFQVTDFTKTVQSLHYYDSILVVEKRPMTEPTRERRGIASFGDYEHQSPLLLEKLKRKLRRK